jgi:hypothetical protein
MEFIFPETPVIEKKRWKCEIHSILISQGSPCYECKREKEGNAMIESEFRTEENRKIREKNSQPRLRL